MTEYIFTSLKHLMMLLKCNFFRASFLHLTYEKTLIHVACLKGDLLLKARSNYGMLDHCYMEHQVLKQYYSLMIVNIH